MTYSEYAPMTRCETNKYEFNDKPEKPRKGFRNPRGTIHPIDKKIEKAIQLKSR